MPATGPYIGGLRLTHLSWVSRKSLRVAFQSIHAGCLHQLYAGRERIGQTSAVGERSMVAKLKPSTWPQSLVLVAVPPAVSNQEFGRDLPPRPCNRPRINLVASGGSWANAKTIEVVGSDVPGDPIDDENVIAKAVFQWQGAYSLLLPPRRTGFHRLRVQGRDNTPPNGNVGTAAETTVRVVSHPPDLVPVSSRRRFGLTVADGVMVIDCEVA